MPRHGWQSGWSIDRKYTKKRGPLESAFSAHRPDATKGLDVCQFLETHPGEWFTRAELARRCGCSESLVAEVLGVVGSRVAMSRTRPARHCFGRIPVTDDEASTDVSEPILAGDSRASSRDVSAAIVRGVEMVKPHDGMRPVRRSIASRLFLADQVSEELDVVVDVFGAHAKKLASDEVRRVPEVLGVVRSDLVEAGWRIAKGSRASTGVPIQRDPSGRVRADGYHAEGGVALWAETGRSWTNNAFLQHIVEAALCPSIEHVVVAVRRNYEGQPSFDRCAEFVDAMVDSGRLQLPYQSLLLIGF